MEVILLLGASLVEYGYVSGWVSRLAAHYGRRATVHNLGLSGYNSRWLLQIFQDDALLQRYLPYPLPRRAEAAGGRRPLYVTLLLGSNDCSVGAQHVPVEEYKSNLHAILGLIRTKLRPKGGIYFMTIPPIDHNKWRDAWRLAMTDRTFDGSRRYRDAMADVVTADTRQRRDANHTQKHRDGGDVFVVDLFYAILYHGVPRAATEGSAVVYDPQAPWTRLLYDGLHVNNEGGEIFFATLLDALRRSPYAQIIMAEHLPYVFPSFEAILAGKATVSGSKL
ncbi:esterase [Strigomonas culicis]|uniref:Esterase n=1 Tax=Strigomonas culicis TaxID=28005 RepID=S9VS24_9TRYP|nr:esterase [Strigomonas culicis]|eukprot:EPY29921.1 esterase [Strigomonas culicis]